MPQSRHNSTQPSSTMATRDGCMPFLVENGISISELTTSGSSLEIHTMDEEENEVEHTKSTHTLAEDTLGQHVIKPFVELAKEMDNVDVHSYVKKKLLEEGGGDVIDENCTVNIAYSGYFEGSTKPFDLKPSVKPLVSYLSESNLLPGLQTAVLTMRVGELSMFLLSYRVMYGKMGNPPLIKPQADCLFYIKLIRSQLTPDIRSSSQPITFDSLLKKAKGLFKNGSISFHNSNIPMAIRSFNRAVNMMHYARLADEEDEKKQEELLLKLYLNLAICYIHSKNPRRACTMCNEIHRLSNIWNNWKALYQNAKALRMIGEFKGAERKLNRALKLCPAMSKEINEEINKVNAQSKSYERFELLAQRLEKDLSKDSVSEEFKAEVTDLVKNFAQDQDICKIALPRMLNSAEKSYVCELAKQYNVNCESVKKGMALDKMPADDPKKSVFDD